VLLGHRQLTMNDVIKSEQGKGGDSFMLTALGPGSFGISYFDEGTLLVLGPGSRKRVWRETGRCLARNVGAISLVLLSLQKFIAKSDRLGKGRPFVPKLADAARDLLDDVAENYQNTFSKRYFACSVALKQVRVKSAPAPTAATPAVSSQTSTP
jgi:hypothetical protein